MTIDERHPQDPAEGSRETIEHELQAQETNRRETGARKLEARDEPAEEEIDRPGFDLGDAKDRGQQKLKNPIDPVGKGGEATGRADGFSDTSAARARSAETWAARRKGLAASVLSRAARQLAGTSRRWRP